MEIKNLQNINREIILATFCKVFPDDFSSFPTDYWLELGIDWNESFGVFDGDALVAFMLNRKTEKGFSIFSLGVDLTYRGQDLAEKLLNMTSGPLRLEVRRDNRQALALYRKTGFVITREMISLEGELQMIPLIESKFSYHILPYKEDPAYQELRLHKPSLESRPEILSNLKYLHETHELRHKEELIAYAHYTPRSMQLREIGAKRMEYLDCLFFQMKLCKEPLRVLNIETGSRLLVDYFLTRGFKIFMTQFEMNRQ